MNQSFINRIKQDKYFAHLNNKPTSNGIYRSLFVSSDRWQYGDLYGISFLPKYKKKLEPFRTYTAERKMASNKALYIIGDSFLADKNINHAFDKFDNVIFIDRRFPFGPINLDRSKQNYLLLEFAERNLVNYNFERSKNSNSSAFIASGTENTSSSNRLISRLFNIIFNKDLSRNIELIIFDHKWTTPFKETKAYLNYKLFNRTANEVAVSRNGSRLFLNSTIDTTSQLSSFRPVNRLKIDTILNSLSNAKKYYTSIGFKNTYLSIIPNPVSIFDGKRMPYNHLLNKIEENTALENIKIYDLFKSSTKNTFYISDSHWNPVGLDLWIKTSNQFFNAHID